MRVLRIIGVTLFFAVVFSLAFYFGWNSAEIKIKPETASVGSIVRAEPATGAVGGASANSKKEINLVFVGDVMLSRGVANQIKKHNDFNYPFLEISEYLKKADLVFGNLEGPISKNGKNQGSIYSFRAEPNVVDGLSFAGFSVMSVANNHIMDWGAQALVDTVNDLRDKGIAAVGAGKDYASANQPVVLERNGVKIAFLAYTNLLPKSLTATEDTAGVSDFDILKIKTRIADLRKNSHVVVVSMHWGEEYQQKANLAQKKIAHELIDAGADLVIGHHPHVPEEVERYEQGWIFYSLGNFVFDQNFSEETMGGLMAKVKIVDGKIDSVEPIKVKISPTFQPYIPTNM